MRRSLHRAAALAAAVALVVPAVASATNGYFLIGFGAKSRGMGGVGIAYGQDGLAAAANPAAMIMVPGTLRADMGGELFVPRRAVVQESATLPADARSGANLFLIPSMGMIIKPTQDLAVGFAAVGAGLGTRYDQTVPGIPTCHDGNTSGGVGSNFFNFNCLGSTTVGVSLMQMQMLPSVAYRFWHNQTIGVSGVFAVQQFRAYGLQAFQTLRFAATSQNLTNQGNDWAYGGGVRVGWLGQFFNDRLALGANWSSRVYMTKFNKYRNLFADGGGFDIPENYGVGMSYKVTPALVVAIDVQRIKWSSIASVGNPGPNPASPNAFFPPGFGKLGLPNGLGFGWQDRTAYKLGVAYRVNKQFTVRAGYDHMNSPIPNDQVLFNMLAPATVENHLTLGASYRPNNTMEWSVNYMHAFQKTIKGPTAFGPSGAPVIGQNAAISMVQNSLGVSFGYHF
ncbi:MAG: OmpP1/FadL family transporter [Gammaproteobacteria bacterium]